MINIFHKNPPYITIKKSLIINAGKGAFSNIYIDKNTFIGYYKGVISTIYPQNNSKYIFETTIDGETIYIDAMDKKKSNWTRYINCADKYHNANIEARENNDGVISFYTIYNIYKGEELLFDYGSEYWKNM